MITTFEVGALFKIVDEASPALKKILATVRELSKVVKTVADELKILGRPFATTGVIAEVDRIAGAWRAVAFEANAARMAMNRAGRGGVGAPATIAGHRRANTAAAASGGGRGGGIRGHFGGIGIPMPGGSHAYIRGHGARSNLGLGTAAAFGYGMYEELELQDTMTTLLDLHLKQEMTAANYERLRGIILQGYSTTGMPLKDITEAAGQTVRGLSGSMKPDAILDILPEILKAAATEARSKGQGTTSVGAAESLIGLAHMTKEYGSEGIKKLAPYFGFLSSTSFAPLKQIERAASYAVPILQSQMDVDPLQTLLLSNALSVAGATSSKSGTWLREMGQRAMPGTNLMSQKRYNQHQSILKSLGLVDESGKPTWFTDDKPDLMKMLSIAGPRSRQLDVTQRNAAEKYLFGERGGGGFAILQDPKIQERLKQLQADYPEYAKRYKTFQEDYLANSPLQRMRIVMAELTVALMDIARVALPAFASALKTVSNILNVLTGKGTTLSAGDEIKAGAGAGAMVGFGVAGLPGAIAGAGIGGSVAAVDAAAKSLPVIGGLLEDVQRLAPAAVLASGGLSTLLRALKEFFTLGHGEGKPGEPAKKMNYLQGPPGRGGEGMGSIVVNLDGAAVGSGVMRYLADQLGGPATTSPAYTSSASIMDSAAGSNLT